MTPPAERLASSDVERGREAYRNRAWQDAFDAFSRVDAESPLDAEDIELMATAAFMVARDDDAVGYLERAHRLRLERGETLAAAHSAIWICLNLATRNQVAPATGWLRRAQRLLEQHPESGKRGYLLLPLTFQQEAAGDFEAAAATAAQAVEIAERSGERELFALAAYGQGHALVKTGRVRDGAALLDEAMVAVTTEELWPVVVGVVYCGVILACQDAYDARRAREWTFALERWCREQPQMVAFTGRCLVHRAEVLQLNGSWAEALEEARLAAERFEETGNRAAGLAHYRRAELLRLRGDFAAAEAAYRTASRAGWEPQPGLAQLRLAQGQVDAAVASIRRARAETDDPLKLAALLPAQVEIALAAGDVEKARTACLELVEIAERYESSMLSAMVAHARGAVHVAEGDPRGALLALRRSLETWHALDAPYEVARTRLLVGRACRTLDDEDSAALELEAAREIFAELGAAPDLAVVESLLQRTPVERHGLSARELEVLRLVAAGKSNRQIAAELVISEHTVARHLQNIFAKLGISSRSAATAFAFAHELV